MASQPLNPVQETLTNLDRTDNSKANRVEIKSLLTPKKRKKTLRFLGTQKLFPRARLSANMNIDFENYL